MSLDERYTWCARIVSGHFHHAHLNVFARLVSFISQEMREDIISTLPCLYAVITC